MTDQSLIECLAISHPARYRIRVSGRMDPDWSERLQGMAISTTEEESQGSVTKLSGVLPDQSALIGVLNYLHDCRIPVLSVECVSASPRSE